MAMEPCLGQRRPYPRGSRGSRWAATTTRMARRACRLCCRRCVGALAHGTLCARLDTQNAVIQLPALPHAQITALRQLRCLHLTNSRFERGVSAFQPLAALAGSLEQLRMEACSHVPACLGQLTGLRTLIIPDDGCGTDLGDVDTLEAALPRLQLSCLVLFADYSRPVRLQPGGSLAALCSLGGQADFVCGSLQALSASAPQLQRLAADYADPEPVECLARWAASQPSLQWLGLCVCEGHSMMQLHRQLAAMANLARSKLDLDLSFTSDPVAQLIEAVW